MHDYGRPVVKMSYEYTGCSASRFTEIGNDLPVECCLLHLVYSKQLTTLIALAFVFGYLLSRLFATFACQ